jgi:hypothetical protein
VSTDWIVTLASIIGLAANAIAQIVSAHLFRRTNQSIAFGALCGLMVTVGVLWLTTTLTAQTAPVWSMILLTYAALGFGYWAFLNLNLTSLRIRMIRELLHTDGGISRIELMGRYSPDEFLRRRLERLESSSKQLSRLEDGRWRLKSRTLLTVADIMGVARVIIMPPQRHEQGKKGGWR